MAKRTIIITGDKELTRMLAALERKTASKLHRTASRMAAKLILQEAKSSAPVVSGDYRRSLTVRATKKSRRGMGYRVTQRELKTTAGKKQKVFYGAFLELGWTTGGHRRFHTKSTGDMTLEQLIASTKRKLRYKPKIKTAALLRKVPGKWLMKHAGDRKEREAIKLYHEELRKLIEAEA